MRFSRRALCPALLAALGLLGACAGQPLRPREAVSYRDTTISAGERVVPVRIVAPRSGSARLVLFSHGANSEPARYDRLTAALAAAGYVVAAPVHADSPWHPGGGKVSMDDSWRLRIADMRALLDARAALAEAAGVAIRAGPVAAAGHSYGALVAQALGGARVERPGDSRDARVAVVLAYSPPGPIPKLIGSEGWVRITAPMLVQTGTADMLPSIAPQWEAHLASFDAAPGPKLLIVGEGVDHYFGNLIGRPERPAPTRDVAAAFDATMAVSMDALRLWLDGDRRARSRLAARRFPATVVARYSFRP